MIHFKTIIFCSLIKISIEDTHTLSIADLMCKEYILKTRAIIPDVSVCAKPLPLIIEGQSVSEGEFPHMAIIALQNKGSSKLHWVCGGSLISELFVMTAAHCMEPSSYGEPRRIRFGCVHIDDKEYLQERLIAEIVKHPQRKGYYNDIALLRMDFPVKFTLHVRPACLNTDENLMVKSLIATGFGVTEYASSKLSEELMKTVLQIYSNENCTNIYKKIINGVLPKGILPEQMCVGNPYGVSDTCSGDSGGPLQTALPNEPCMYNIVAITSFGLFCGQPNTPSFSVRVSSYIPWIEKIVWKKKY